MSLGKAYWIRQDSSLPFRIFNLVGELVSSYIIVHVPTFANLNFGLFALETGKIVLF
jgi:hypothetical protein